MSRYIDADEAIRRIDLYIEGGSMFKSVLRSIKRLVNNAPTADLVEVVYASWETELDDMGWKKHTCQNCGFVKQTDIHISLGWNYCPNCGAKMDGKKVE
jgi:rubredoxin